jgi:hypothetical protein
MATATNKPRAATWLPHEAQERGLDVHTKQSRGRLHTGCLDREGLISGSQAENLRYRRVLQHALALGKPVRSAIKAFERALEEGDDGTIDCAETSVREALAMHSEQFDYIDRIHVVQAVRRGVMGTLRKEDEEQRKDTQASAAASSQPTVVVEPEKTVSHLNRVYPQGVPPDGEEYNPHNLAHFLRRSQPVCLAVASICREYTAVGEGRQERMKTILREQLLRAGASVEDAERFVNNVVEAARKDVVVNGRGCRSR